MYDAFTSDLEKENAEEAEAQEAVFRLAIAGSAGVALPDVGLLLRDLDLGA